MTFRRRLVLAWAATLAAGLAVLVVAGNLLLDHAVDGQERLLRLHHRSLGAGVVDYDIARLHDLQADVAAGSVVIAAIVLVGGGLVLRAALTRALRPVVQMTASAEDWGAHDLESRFAMGAARDELTALAATLDGLLGRIAASRRHELRFAGEIAHELRTPLAGLQLRAELALATTGEPGERERRDALEAVVAEVTGLSRAIESLLAVARREIDPSTGSVDVGAIARGFDGLEVAGEAPPAEGDPEIVHRALTPLVENARRHARSSVRIELSAGDGHVRVAVRDDGPGLDPGLGDAAFEPGVRGAHEPPGGSGLGLALARRLARSCGGEVVAGDGPGGCFVLELPALGARGSWSGSGQAPRSILPRCSPRSPSR